MDAAGALEDYGYYQIVNVQATPSGYVEKGRFSIPDKGFPSWAHPVISDGKLYVRNQDSMMAYDIKAK